MPFVRGYVRSDGTPVRAHFRWAPGARQQMTIFAVVALVVVSYGHSNTEAQDGKSPRPASTVTYPIHFNRTPDVPRKAAQPRPTVSYPIKFPTPKKRPAPPKPTVSYPIDFSKLGGGR